MYQLYLLEALSQAQGLPTFRHHFANVHHLDDAVKIVQAFAQSGRQGEWEWLIQDDDLRHYVVVHGTACLVHTAQPPT